MIDDDTQEWVLKAIDHVYPGKRKTNIPIMSTVVTDDGVGILMMHDQEMQYLCAGAAVLSGVTYSEDLVRELGSMNTGSQTVFGAYNLHEGQNGYWSIYYSMKLRYNWLDCTSQTNAKMLVDILSAVRQFTVRARQELEPNHGGEPYVVSEGWWVPLLDNL